MRLAKFFNHDFNKGDFRLYNSKGNEVYLETSDGHWAKWEYDSKGNRIYYEASSGYIVDNRKYEVVIDGKKVELSAESYKALKDSLK